MPTEEYRTYRLCTMLRCPPSALDNESAVTLDWLLAVEDAVNRAKRNLEEAANRG